jgi:hypothetical protein
MLALMSLLPEERDFVWALRDVREGRLRTELLALLKEVLAAARSPHCGQAQADGVPCACLGVPCEDCERVLAAFRRLRASTAA